MALERRLSDRRRKKDEVQTLSVSARESIAKGPLVFLMIVVFLVLACAVSEFFCRYVLHLSGEYIYPLKDRSQTFFDFVLYTRKFQYFRQPAFFMIGPPLMYPAPVAVVYALFFCCQPYSLALFLGFIIGAFLVAGLMLFRELRRRKVESNNAFGYIVASFVLAYPLWFELKQGNIEIVVWVLLAVGVWAFFKGQNYGAAACFRPCRQHGDFSLRLSGIVDLTAKISCSRFFRFCRTGRYVCLTLGGWSQSSEYLA